MKSKKNLIILAIVIAISLLGVTYAFFDYYMLGSNQKITAGKVNLVFNEGDDTIDRGNIFPETIEKARARTDNFITFTVSGVNTTEDQDIYYEIMLNEGDSETGMTRFNPEDLVFDLIEVNGETETYLVEAMSYSDFNAKRIWVNTVDRNNATVINKTYKLRMWLSEDVLISDSNPNANYPATGYENYYASVKVSVYGDFVEKTSPYNYMKRIGVVDMETGAMAYWSDEIEAQKANITEVNFVSMKQTKIQERYTVATIKEDMTDTTKSEAGSVLAWLEPGELVNIDGTETQQYKMYVASEGTTFFPSDSSGMFAMFMGLTEINFDNVDTRDVTNMIVMFIACSSLTNLDIDNWNTSNVEDMLGTFWECASLSSLKISSWDTSNVTSMAGMFVDCPNLTDINLSSWNTNNVTDMTSMFNGCTNLTTLDLTDWDTSSVTSMTSMFMSCMNLTELDINNWDTSNVTSMSSMFYSCTNLTTLDLNNWNVKKVEDMGTMFWGCTNLITIDLTSFDTSNVTDMSFMFRDCTNLKTIYANTDWNTSNVTYYTDMFLDCTSLVGAVPFDSTKTDITMANPTTGYFTKKES